MSTRNAGRKDHRIEAGRGSWRLGTPLAVIVLLALVLPLSAQQWKSLFNGRNLDGWEVRGDSIWTVMKDGTLIGQRPYPGLSPFGGWPVSAEQFRHWFNEQSWLYTVDEFDEFDLSLEYWIPQGANSGVSIRDTSRARYAFGPEMGKQRPSHVGYEIQIVNPDEGKYPSGSIYLFTPAKEHNQRGNDWNKMVIQSRHDAIRVILNGVTVAESAGDPKRPKIGPIGLQLHDRYTWVMFRNIRIRELSRH